jgi:hypothetical protein
VVRDSVEVLTRATNKFCGLVLRETELDVTGLSENDGLDVARYERGYLLQSCPNEEKRWEPYNASFVCSSGILSHARNCLTPF